MIFGVITIVAILIAAGTIIPMVKSENSVETSNFIPRTVEVNSNPLADKLTTVFDDVTWVPSNDINGNPTYRASVTIGEAFPNAPGSIKDVQMDILVTFEPNVSDPIVTYNVHSDTFNQSKLDYSIEYDKNGNVNDVVFTYDGTTTSLKELYDPFDDCFLFLLALVPYIVAIVAAAAVVVVASQLPQNGGTVDKELVDKTILFFKVSLMLPGALVNSLFNKPENIKWVQVVDGILFSETTDGRLIAISIDGHKYSIADMLTKPPSDKGNNYYYVLRYGTTLYFSPIPISKTEAQNIMKLPYNNDSKHNVWTYLDANARLIAEVLGAPAVGPEIDQNKPGYFQHFHTIKRSTNAHAFFGMPVA